MTSKFILLVFTFTLNLFSSFNFYLRSQSPPLPIFKHLSCLVILSSITGINSFPAAQAKRLRDMCTFLSLIRQNILVLTLKYIIDFSSVLSLLLHLSSTKHNIQLIRLSATFVSFLSILYRAARVIASKCKPYCVAPCLNTSKDFLLHLGKKSKLLVIV